MVHGLSCSAACGIFPDEGSNPCPLHWQADSQPLCHQGNPSIASWTPLSPSVVEPKFMCPTHSEAKQVCVYVFLCLCLCVWHRVLFNLFCSASGWVSLYSFYLPLGNPNILSCTSIISIFSFQKYLRILEFLNLLCSYPVELFIF